MLKKSLSSGLIIVFCTFVAPETLAVDRDNFLVRDARDLVSLCQTPTSDALYGPAIHFCQGFIVGAYRYYLDTMKDPDAKPFVCLPKPNPSRDEIVAQFVAWMKGHSQYNGDDGVDVLFRFGSEKYPCPD